MWHFRLAKLDKGSSVILTPSARTETSQWGSFKPKINLGKVSRVYFMDTVAGWWVKCSLVLAHGLESEIEWNIMTGLWHHNHGDEHRHSWNTFFQSLVDFFFGGVVLIFPLVTVDGQAAYSMHFFSWLLINQWNFKFVGIEICASWRCDHDVNDVCSMGVVQAHFSVVCWSSC